MTNDRPAYATISPVPAALLALSVIVCMGTMAQAGPIQPLAAQSRPQALNQRDDLGQLFSAIREATQNQTYKPAATTRGTAQTAAGDAVSNSAWTTSLAPVAGPLPPMRSSLLNLPPPALR